MTNRIHKKWYISNSNSNAKQLSKYEQVEVGRESVVEPKQLTKLPQDTTLIYGNLVIPKVGMACMVVSSGTTVMLG